MALKQPRTVILAAVALLAVILVVTIGGDPAPRPGPGAGRAAGGGRGGGEAAGPRPDAPPGRCQGVRVRPGDDLQAAADAHPEGTGFCLTVGVHRLASVVPRNGQRFRGEGGRTVLSGARRLQAARARRDAGGRWYWDGQTQESARSGKLIDPGPGQPPNEGDLWAEELFVTPSGSPADSPTRLRRTTSLVGLGPGEWYLDQAADRVYVADDPADLGLIETSVTRMAIGAPTPAGPREVTVENLVVEKYASPTQRAAVGGAGAADWTIRWVTVRFNHGTGVELGPGTLLERSKIHHMGQEGLSGGGDATRRPTVVRGTEVAFNRTLTFDPDWDAGGAKLTHAHGRGLVVENSWFHHNFGYGLWLDIDNHDVTVRSNRFEANDEAGIFYEVSRRGRIYWNEVFGSTDGPKDSEFGGAGIRVYNSADVDVHHNLVRDNTNGILVVEDRQVTRWAAGRYRQGVPHVQAVRIRGNDVQMLRGVTGMRVESGDARAYWRPSNVRFAGNTYRMERARERFLGPGNDYYGYAEWRRLGHDRDGRLLPAASHGSLPAGATAFVMGVYGAQGGI
jgi:hypothetical protein